MAEIRWDRDKSHCHQLPAPYPWTPPLWGDELVARHSCDGAVFDQGSSLLFRARKVPKAQLAEMASRVLWGCPVRLALWAPLEKTEIR